MGTSQSRTASEGSSATIDKLKRYSRADLKSPLKAAFGRQQPQQQQPQDSVAPTVGHAATKPEGTESTPASDYETPIYETSQRKAAAAVRCNPCFLGGCVRMRTLLYLLLHHLPFSASPSSTPSTIAVNACHRSLRGIFA